MKICTSQLLAKGPYAWAATVEDGGSRNLVGCGATEQEAIDDLKRLLNEKAECEEDERERREERS